MAMLQKGRQPLVMLLLMPMEGTGLKVMLMLTQKLRRRRKPKVMMLLTGRTKKIYLKVIFMGFIQQFLNTVIFPQLTVISWQFMNLNGNAVCLQVV